MIEVPAAVQAKARVAGAGGWLDDLPTLVASLEDEWGLRVGPAYADATEAFVAPAAPRQGPPAVLKVLVPQPAVDPRHEITVLRLAGGEGCARLLRHDEDRGALLVERLGPSLHDLGLPLARRTEVLCAAARRVWRPAPGAGLPDGAEKGAIPRRPRHQELIDPDGLLAEPECDLGVLMREDPVELLQGDPRERARHLAVLAGLDAEAVWEWGVVKRVSTGGLATRIGLQPVGRQMLAAADVVAE